MTPLALALSLTLHVAAADDDGGVRILVTDLKTTADVSEDAGSVIGGIVTSRLSRYPRAQVLSGADIREMIALEAEKQAAGCDDAGCLAEVAGALGARLIVTGQVGRLGERIVISLSVIDVDDARAVARETRELDELANAPEVVRPMVDELMKPMRDKVGRPSDQVTFLDVVSGSFTWTGYGLFGTGLVTLALQSLIYGIAGGAQLPGHYETAWIPVCGPFFGFLGSGPGQPGANEPLNDLAFACCACEAMSCGAILIGSPLIATGLLVDLIPDEDEDGVAAGLLAPPEPDPLSPDERRRLARMAY